MRKIPALVLVFAGLIGSNAWAASPEAPDPLPVLGTQPGKNGLIVFEQQRKCGERCGEYATGRPGIYSLNLRTGKRKLLVPGPAAQSPNFARGGRRIVYSNRKFGQTDIYTMNLDGSGRQRVTNDELVEVDPAFLANGRIGYLSLDALPYEYFSIKRNGKDRQPAGFYRPFESAGSVSASSGDVVFTSCAAYLGPCHVFVRDVFDGSSKELTVGEVIDSGAIFSPGRRLIAYIRNRTEGSDDCCLEPGVWIMVASGKRNRQIVWSKPNAEIRGIDFSPDGSKLLVESFRPHQSGPGGFGWIDVVGLSKSGTKRIRASRGRGVIEDAVWQHR
ncbi:MAG: hypothetical protein WBW44_04665 [Solirubrobacterales bacterium]